MKFDVLTLFPEIIENYCSASVIGRAAKQEIISVNTINPRDFTESKHKKVDDIQNKMADKLVNALNAYTKKQGY